MSENIENQLYRVVAKAKMYDKLLRFSKHVDELCCSFCNKGQSEIEKLVAGPNVYICDECVELCREIIDETANKVAENE